MKQLKSYELRELYLEFFKEHGHTVIPSASLIPEIGDPSHCTFFEMLGNWSLGDYFKKEAIAWSFEFLTSEKWLGIPKEKLYFTCFAGDENAPKDTESHDLWVAQGVDESHIFYLGKEHNWWGPAGETGPCGPACSGLPAAAAAGRTMPA